MKVEVSRCRDGYDGGSIWTGKNQKKYGGEFFLGLAGGYESTSLRIPDQDRAKVARLLRRFADKLAPEAGKGGA